MTTQKLRNLYTLSLVLLDGLLTAAAFVIGFQLRARIPFPEELVNQVPLRAYSVLVAFEIVAIVGSLFAYRQYYVRRAVSRVDQFYAVVVGVTLGTLIAVAMAALLLKNEESLFDFSRGVVFYAWLLTIIFVMVGRTTHQQLRMMLRRRGWDKDRLLIVGSGETARIILQRILWSPQLGYDVVGIVDVDSGVKQVLDIPVIGRTEALPELIETHHIDEVLLAIPKKGHREVVRIIALCKRGRVSIKVVPDIYHSITSEATIDDLGGLPLLTVKDISMRGYQLFMKRLLDLSGAVVGLVVLAPLLLLVSLAIKLESPGPVFFVQERMGLDGKPFMILKFRSMRLDAERQGPGWTVDNDPRQTRLGRLLRKIDIDEVPQLINVLLGEMSLVGPRPEQPHYVEQFRRRVPRYMERHQEKAGMTGWAQVNGLRGDTSIEERTRYDLWYTENWSILLDIKIILRTVWQTIVAREGTAQIDEEELPVLEPLLEVLDPIEPQAAAGRHKRPVETTSP